MLGIFKSKTYRIDGIELTSFTHWAEKLDCAGSKMMRGGMTIGAQNAYSSAKKAMIQEFFTLSTLEAKLFAAYTAFDDELKDLAEKQLTNHPPTEQLVVLDRVDRAFSNQGLEGCRHLLRKGYSSSFAKISIVPPSKRLEWMREVYRFPDTWLKDAITVQDLELLHRNAYLTSIADHSLSPNATSKTIFEWAILGEEIEQGGIIIRNFNSGFSTGIAIYRDGNCVGTHTFCHFRPSN